MTATLSWSRRADLPPDAESVAAARKFVREHLALPGLEHVLEDALVVVSELVTNAVVHARTPLKVSVGQLRGAAFLAVRDGSPRVLFAQRLPISATHGRGLHVVEACSTDWGVISEPDGGKSVWATFEPQERARSG